MRKSDINDTPPWEKPPPKSPKKAKMTKAQITKARERAAKAGRSYPNLVDNMAVLKDAKN